jgi:amino acid transporter
VKFDRFEIYVSSFYPRSIIIIIIIIILIYIIYIVDIMHVHEYDWCSLRHVLLCKTVC